MEVNSKDLWTAVWHLQQDPPQPKPALRLLKTTLGVSNTTSDEEPAIPAGTGRKLLRCPFATTQGLPNARTRGKYSKGYPEGAIVHFTAGSHRQKDSDALQLQVDNGHVYFVVTPTGEILQNFPLDRWGYHAGPSRWDGFENGVNDNMVGIEVMCPGKLNGNRAPWYNKGRSFPESECRQVASTDQIEGGWYRKFSEPQEQSLRKLILWLHSNNPAVFKLKYVLGHDEVSGPLGLGRRRKNDPGGSLSVTMEDFRSSLKG